MGNLLSSPSEPAKEPENVVQQEPRGTDSTFRVDDLLRVCKGSVQYEAHVEPYVEELPVPGAFLVHNLLTPEECQQYIRLAEEMGFEASPLRELNEVNSNNARRNASTQTIRNSLRVLFDCPEEIAKPLNDRLLPHLPPAVECSGRSWKVYEPECINARWRFNRYDKGHYFRPHFDAGYRYSDTKETLMTFILYLSDGFEGGETSFFPGNKKFAWSREPDAVQHDVVPKAGMALVFFQVGDLSPRHEGVELRGDIPKYILRSDLTYHVPQE